VVQACTTWKHWEEWEHHILWGTTFRLKTEQVIVDKYMLATQAQFLLAVWLYSTPLDEPIRVSPACTLEANH